MRDDLHRRPSGALTGLQPGPPVEVAGHARKAALGASFPIRVSTSASPVGATAGGAAPIHGGDERNFSDKTGSQRLVCHDGIIGTTAQNCTGQSAVQVPQATI